MARTITAGQRTQLASRRAAHFLRVEVQDAMGQWRDLRAVSSADYQLGATVASSLDGPTTTATVTLRAGRSFASIAPGMTGATANATGRLLDVGRGVRIDVAVLAPGSTPGAGDWVRLFDGIVDTVGISQEGQRITLRARDRLVPVLDAMVTSQATVLGPAVETVLQGMLTAVLSSPPTLVTPVSPAWSPGNVPPLKVGESLWARMSELVDRLGWLLRYRWSGNSPELRFFAPVRQPTAGDVSFSWASTEVRSLDAVDLDLAPVRNLVHVDWKNGGVTQRATASNGTSQVLYGTRPVVIVENGQTSPITTTTAAQRFADAVLADLQAPPLAYRASHVHCFWPVEVGDVLDVAPDGSAFDATQRLGVVSVEHQLDEGGGRTTVGLRGAPASKGRAWLSLGGAGGPESTDPTSASASFLSTGAVRINVIGPTDATQVRAAVSTSGAPTAADVDAATGSMAANASMAALTSAASYGVGTTVFVAARAYVGGVGGRVVQLQIQRDAAAGSVAVGPDLEVRLALSATDGTVTYLGDGTIEISEDGGAWSAAPASPFSRARGAQGSDTVRTVTLRATLNGQSISNTVVIPARATVDTDTVTPDLRLIRQSAAGGDAAAYVEYVVQATNPKAGGPAPTVVGTWLGTVVERFNGSTWVTMTSGAALFAGDTLRLTRPAYDATPGTFTARATLGAGQGAEEITLEIPPRPSPLPPAVVAEITSRTATTTTVTVRTAPAGGVVRWLGGTAVPTAGQPAVNTDQPSGTAWTFQRRGINEGDDSATFRGVVNGVSDEDVVTITEQGRDTVALLTRARVIALGPTTYTVRVSASAPFADRDGTIELVQANGVTVTLGAAARPEGSTDAVTTSQSDGYYGTIGGAAGVAFRDYVVTRPAIGAQPGRVTFRVSAAGLTADADSVDIPAQAALVPARLELVGFLESGADIVVRWRAWWATGAEIASVAAVDGAGRQSSGGASTTTSYAVTRDTVNGWFTYTIPRTAGADVAAVLTVGVQESEGTARTQLAVPLPTYVPPAGTAGPRFTFASVNFAGPSFDQVTLQWGVLEMPSGVTYEAVVTVRNVLRRFAPITSGDQIGIGKSTQDGSYPVLTRVTGTVYALSGGQRIAEIGVPETVVYVPTNET